VEGIQLVKASILSYKNKRIYSLILNFIFLKWWKIILINLKSSLMNISILLN